ncbi:MAG: outer membrane beta-barrel protein [Holophaga sp.]|nr:outer membrane beta-barrel protein [Holophaga sp.]
MALACACGAAESEDPYRYGIRITSSSPAQDFRDISSRTGFGGGLFVETPVGSGWVAQTRLDYISYPQTNRPTAAMIARYTSANPITLSIDSAALGVDLRHPLPGLKGFYGLIGMTAIRYEFQSSSVSNLIDQNGIPIPGVIRYKDKTSFKLGLAVGVGFEIYRGLALSERFTTANILGTTFGTLETSLSYRF